MACRQQTSGVRFRIAQANRKVRFGEYGATMGTVKRFSPKCISKRYGVRSVRNFVRSLQIQHGQLVTIENP